MRISDWSSDVCSSDLPPKDGSVDPDDAFAMQWQLYPDKTKRMKEIQDAAKTADRLILATDPDREGEAISWHVQELLRSKKALPASVEIGRAHVRNPVTNEHIVCRVLIDKQTNKQ